MTLIVMVGIIVAALAGALYMMRRADARVRALDVAEHEVLIPVEVYEVRKVDLPVRIEARGFLSGIEEVTIRSEAAGRVLTRAVAEGDWVAAGEVLLTIDETFHALRRKRAEAELKKAHASLGDARAGVRQMEAQLASAQAVRANRAEEYERIERLHESGNAPKIEYERIATAFRTAEADLAAAEAALTRVIDRRATAEAAITIAQAARDEAQAHLERCVVRSPITGWINRFHVEEGEYVVVTAPLVEVVRLDEMKMNVEIADTEVLLLESFTRAEVTADAAGTVIHEARLHHVAPKVDPFSKKFRVELRVGNKDEALRSGMYGRAVLYCGWMPGMMPIPREAVFKHFGADFCMVVTDEEGTRRARLRRTEVRSIAGRLDEVRVLAGLREGDRVIVSRRRELRDGVPVTVAQTQPSGGASVPEP